MRINGKLKLKDKIGYGVAAIGDSGSYTLISIYLLFFLTTVVGIDPVIAGTITATGAVWNTLWSPVIGYFSDHTSTRFGRRVPYIFAAAFPLAIANFLLFSTIDMGGSGRILYYIVMVIVFWSAFSGFFNPYLALGSEITGDYNERTSVRAYAYIFNVIGMSLGMVLPTYIVDFLMNRGKSIQESWQLVGLFIGIITFISLMITAVTMGRKEEKKKAQGQFGVGGMFRDYWQILKLRPLRWLLVTSVIYLCAHTISSANRIYFMTYNMAMTGKEISLAMVTLLVGGILFTPIVAGVSKRFDKRKAFIIFSLISAALITYAKLSGIDSWVGLIAYFLVYSCVNTAYWQLMPAMVYDVCEVDELYSGKRRSGITASMQSLVESLSAAISLQLLGMMLKLAGFNGEAAFQTPTAQLWIENTLTVIAAFFIIAAALAMGRYTVTRGKFEEVMVALEKRRSGKALTEEDYPVFEREKSR